MPNYSGFVGNKPVQLVPSIEDGSASRRASNPFRGRKIQEEKVADAIIAALDTNSFNIKLMVDILMLELPEELRGRLNGLINHLILHYDDMYEVSR